ncbi:hypothetical protein CC86DRAFT_369026 [Ophiobolus disseminans]|uniref:Uncharacterized protein n=1 Tax=Ophiobolus disseminans TaxID=1469910 RepID=A0A6A7A4R1_9PLEO|nr:hypothetical protein CC86DRAFT_369026 [Ophiobolus disseminans]
MGLIVQLRYFCRAALRLFDCVKGFRLVKIECLRISSQTVELHVIFTSGRDTTKNKFRVAVVQVTSPLALAKPMKKSTIARCTMANELLRRRDQPGRDSTLRSRRSLQHRADHLHVSFQENAGAVIGPEQGRTRDGTDATPSTGISIRNGNGGEPTNRTGNAPPHYPPPCTAANSARAAHHDSAHTKHTDTDCDDTGISRGRTSHQRRPSMWRMGLLYLDRGDSGILAALKNAGGHDNNNRPPPGSPQAHFSPTSEAEQRVLDGRTRRRSLSQSSVQWVSPPDGSSVKFGLPRAKPDGDTFSPNSERTLFEEPEMLSLDRVQPTPGSPDYFSFDNVSGDQTSGTEVMPAPIQRRVRHSRAPSTEPNFRNPKRASLPLRARTKTNEGLLQLQANPSKAERPTSQHERRISLGIPLKPAITQTEGLQRSKFGSLIDTPPQTPRTPRTPRSRAPEKSGPAATLRQKERDLEYKHRHTFIGTASLDDFLEVLDVSSEEHTTTKAAVGKAFLILASSERLLARQASSTSAGWDLVSRTIPDVVNTDYVVQAHVKLGSITLWQFLDLIPFNDEEEAGAMSVVEAYSAASHMDSKAGNGATSKAKAFRSWMVNHGEKES